MAHTTGVESRESPRGLATRAMCSCNWHGFWGAPTEAREWAIESSVIDGKEHKREMRRIARYGK